MAAYTMSTGVRSTALGIDGRYHYCATGVGIFRVLSIYSENKNLTVGELPYVGVHEDSCLSQFHRESRDENV